MCDKGEPPRVYTWLLLNLNKNKKMGKSNADIVVPVPKKLVRLSFGHLTFDVRYLIKICVS